MKGASPLFLFLKDAAICGERTALVTITDVVEQSLRAIPGMVGSDELEINPFSGQAVHWA